MTVPTTTPGTLGRVRAWITNTRASDDRSIGRRIASGSLLAALPAIAVLALTGALATPGALADQRSAARVSADDCEDKEPILIETRGRWRCQNFYMARVALDGPGRPQSQDQPPGRWRFCQHRMPGLRSWPVVGQGARRLLRPRQVHEDALYGVDRRRARVRW